MDEVSRNTLERFVENVEELKENCTPENNYGGLMGIFRKAHEEEWHMHPAIKGLLLTFSMFIKSRDGIAPYVLERDGTGQPTRPKLLDLPGPSASWREKVEQAYTLFDTVLSFAPPKLVYDRQPITRWEVLETFMYGNYAHVNPAKYETYKLWKRDPDLFGELQLTFQDAIAFMFFEILVPIAEASKHELSWNASSNADFSGTRPYRAISKLCDYYALLSLSQSYSVFSYLQHFSYRMRATVLVGKHLDLEYRGFKALVPP